MTIQVPAYVAASCLPRESQGPSTEPRAPGNPVGKVLVRLRANAWPRVTQGG